MYFSNIALLYDDDSNDLEKDILFFESAPINMHMLKLNQWQLFFSKNIKLSSKVNSIICYISSINSFKKLSYYLSTYCLKNDAKIFLKLDIQQSTIEPYAISLWLLAQNIDFELLVIGKKNNWVSSFQIRKNGTQNFFRLFSEDKAIDKEDFLLMILSTLNNFALDAELMSYFLLKDVKISIFKTKYCHFSNNSGPAVPFRLLSKNSKFVVNIRDAELKEELDKTGIDSDNLSFLSNNYFKFRSAIEDFGQKVIYKNMIIQEADNFFRCIRNNIVNIIHFIDGEHAGSLSLFLKNSTFAKKSDLKILITLHQPIDILEQIFNIERLKEFDAIHVLSPCQYDGLIARGFSKNKLFLIPHASPYELYAERVSFRRITDKKCLHFLSVGNWQRDYNALELVIDSLDSREYIFHIVASKDQLPQSLQQGKYNNVILYQGISDNLLSKLYTDCDCLLLPLQNATANNAVLEALAHGLPIMTTDLASTRYYIGDCGYFVNNNNVNSYIEEILKFNSLSENDFFVLRQKIFERSRFLSLKNTLERTLLMYKNISENKNGVVIK